MKKILMAIIMMAMIVSPVMAFRDVTCGPGNSVCRENELDDEFDELDNKKVDKWVFNNLKDDVEDLEDDVDDLEHDMWHVEKDIYKIEKENDWQWYKIGKNKKNVEDLEMSIAENDAKWSKDSSGTSMSSVRKFLFGDYFDYLFNIFTPRDEFNALEDKLYLVEAQLYFVENDMEYDDTSLLFKAVALEMEAHQVTEVNHGKYSCSIAGEKVVCVG